MKFPSASLSLCVFLSAFTAAHAAAAWTVRKDGRGVADVVWTGTRYVAAAANAKVLLSENGIDWRMTAVGTKSFHTLLWTGREVLAYGDSMVYSSADGLTWTGTSTTPTRRPYRPVWNGNRFVAIGPGKRLLGSVDGKTWDSVASNPRYLRNILWLDSVFVADTDDSVFMASEDGLQWRTVIASSIQASVIARSNGTFVANGYRGRLFRSIDLKTWTEFGATPSIGYCGLHGTGGGYLAVGCREDSLSISDLDGRNWQYMASGGNSMIESIRRQGDRLFAIGTGGTITESIDSGRTWRVLRSWRNNGLLDIKWNGSRLLAAGTGSTSIESVDGVTWSELTRRDDPVGSWRYWAAASPTVRLDFESIYGSAIASYLATRERISKSSDLGSLHDAQWTGSQFVAVGDSGTILTSPNGTDWTRRSSDSGVLLTDALAEGPLLVAAGDGSNVYTSLDGTKWTKRSLGAAYNLRGLAWTGSKYVDVGFDRTSLTSPDGIVWTPKQRETSASMYDLAWTGSELVGVGVNGVIISSRDGLSWSTDTTVGVTLNSIVWTGKALVAVGDGGLILSSGSLPEPVAVKGRAKEPTASVQVAGLTLRVPDETRTVRFLRADGRGSTTLEPSGALGERGVPLSSLGRGLWIAIPDGPSLEPLRFLR